MFRKLFITILISFSFLTLNSCSLNDIISPIRKLEHGEFYAVQLIGDGQYPIIIKPRKILTRDKVEVYLDDKGSNITLESIEYIVDGFEKAYEGMVSTFGTHTDVDDNGKVIIIFFDINGGVQASEYTAGYFYSYDLIKGYGSNGAEILYVDSVNVGNNPDERNSVLGTVVHEFQHLIDFKMNNVRNNKASDLWMNEARSEASDMIYVQKGKMDNGRLGIYNNPYYGKIISDGNYFYKWDDLTDTATAALFMYWLHVQGGDLVDGIEKGIIHDIAYSPYSYGYQSVVEAVNKKKITRLGGSASWSDILLSWLLSNHIKGVLGFADYDALNLAPKIFAGGNANLYPGDAIITTTKPTLSSANANIISVEAEITSPSFYITLNKSTSMSGGFVTINVPQSASSRSLVANNQKTTPPAKTGKNRIKHISQGDIKVKF